MPNRLTSSVPLLLALASCAPEPEPYARGVVIDSLDQGIGGPKALGRPGDFLLENDRLRIVVVGQRNSMGPGISGGSIIDADLQRHDPRFAGGHGLDQLAEIIPTTNLNVQDIEGGYVELVSDGSDGGPAVLRTAAPAEPFLTMLGALWALLGAPEHWIVTDYIVEPGVPWVRIVTSAVYGWDGQGEPPAPEPAGYFDDAMPVLDLALESGVALGDFYLQGGSVDVFGPDMGFHEDGAIFASMQAGENSFTDPFRFEFVAGTGDGVSYGIAPAEGNGFVPLFTASQTAVIGGGRDGDGTRARFDDGTALSYERYFFVGHGDVGSIVDGYVQARDIPHGTVRGHVIEEGTGQPLTDARVFVYRPGADKPWSAWRTDVHPGDDLLDGSFGGRLPAGDWELLVHKKGRPDGFRVPVTVQEGGEVAVSMEAPRPGLVSFTVSDAEGEPIPAKISLFRDDGPVADPDLGDGFVGGAPEAVLFPMYGEGQVELPDGRYTAIASRGLEYELDTVEFVVDASKRHHLDFVLERSINTDGWVSADLHVHASPSHDSGVALADRARTMVSEGVEFFASTDHDYVTDYGPTIERLGLERWVQSAVGVETTTLEMGHFLAFPMQQDFLGDAGGAMDWTGMVPEDVIGTLYEQGRDAGFDPIVFIGHPRDGILGYFDQFGYSPYGGEPGMAGNPGEPLVQTPILSFTNKLLAAENLSWEFDALELLNGKRLENVRTPTQPELDAFAAGEDVSVYDLLERTMEEQDALADGVYKLGYGRHGGVDDWFTLLNLGFRYTLLGNSDTHDWTSTEAGCPRNYVMSSTDDPAYVDDQEIADAVREHRVVASYGPFLQMWVDGAPVGSEVVPAGREVEIAIDVQAPTWVPVDRVELYENGTLIREWAVDDMAVTDRFYDTITVTPEADAWYVAVAMGDGDLGPVFSPVEIPYIELQEIVTEALAGVDAVSAMLSPAIPVPRIFPVTPYAITNPVWVDLDGDGFDAPGVPDWLEEPDEPAEPEE